MQKKSLLNLSNKNKYIIASAIIMMIVAGAVYWKFFWYSDKPNKISYEDNPIHIALVGPISGSGAAVGKAFQQGVHLYLDAINEKGGVNGRRIALNEFDDGNDSQKAKEQALKIVEENKAVAVIGHHFSSCSISAGEVYKNYSIPAVTPASTNIRVTDENPWYFRAIFNDKLQGRFLANYAKKVLRLDKISIVMDTGTYGSYLTEVFEQTALGLKLEIKYKWKIDSSDKDVEEKIKEIVRQIRSKNDVGALFLPMHTAEGIKFLVHLKDASAGDGSGKLTIMAPDAFTSESFQKGFAHFPKEKQQLGYYTDGIYVTTPLLFDTTNEKGQKFREAYQKKYNEKPGWHAAFAYDSAMLIVEALKHSGFQGLPKTLKDDRSKVRDYLAGLNSSASAIEGVTGYNYFDKHGDSQKPVNMGIYRKLDIVSALIQFQSVLDQDGSKPDKLLLTIDNVNMYQTNVVYTGIEIKEISELDVLNLQCTIDFFIWFRYQEQEKIDVGKVEFINVSAPIDMGQPVYNKSIDQLKYRLYHVKGKFKADFLPNETAYNQHVLGISFRHPDLDRNSLIYVKDVLGMGTSDDEDIADRMIAGHALNTSTGWKISKVLFFQDVIRQSSKGDLDYLNVQQGMVDFSRFNAGIVINENKFSVRSVIPRNYINYIGIASFLTLFGIFLIGDTKRMQPHFKMIWMFQSAFTLLLLLAGEVIITDWVAGKKNLYVEPTVITFNILWWIVPAILATRGIEKFVWKPLEEKTGRAIPNVIRRFLHLIIYILVFFGIIAFVFNQRLTSLLATSGVLAMIVGLALQINIANIFSGIVINIERPFRIGDWVKIGNFPEGKIVDINWRTTKIQTRDDTMLSIPNSQASEAQVENFSFPNAGYWQYFTLHVDPIHPPDRVKKILLDAALSSKFVSKDPAPFTRFLGLTAGITSQSQSYAANYLICIFVPDYGKKFAYNEDVWMNLWKHLRRAGIRVVLPRQETHFFLEGVKRKPERIGKTLMMLQELEIFRPFSTDAKIYLSKKVRQHHYMPGETIVQQGDKGKSLFIIEEGVVGVWVKFDDNPENPLGVEVARMGAGNFFGEMALLTGEARAASIVSITETYLYEITKTDIAPFLEREPQITRLLSNILTERKLATEAQKNQVQTQKIDKETIYDQMLSKIQSFFGFK